MYRKDLKVDQAYYVERDDLFFITPDAVGGFWYNTLEELEDQHGRSNNPRVIRIFELFEL